MSRGSGAAGVYAMDLPIVLDMFVFFDVRRTKVRSSSTGRLKYRPGNISRSGKTGITMGRHNSSFVHKGVY